MWWYWHDHLMMMVSPCFCRELVGKRYFSQKVSSGLCVFTLFFTFSLAWNVSRERGKRVASKHVPVINVLVICPIMLLCVLSASAHGYKLWKLNKSCAWISRVCESLKDFPLSLLISNSIWWWVGRCSERVKIPDFCLLWYGEFCRRSQMLLAYLNMGPRLGGEKLAL